MKTFFISAKAKIDNSNLKFPSKKLPKNLFVAYSIQYKDLAQKIKEKLSKQHNITGITQVLGCSKVRFSKETQAILLIGSGRFHAISLALETSLPIYIYEGNKLHEISKKDVSILQRKQKASYVNFLNADKAGILVSTKPGQENLKQAIEFKKKTKKKTYIFICNNINTSEFENFGLKAWVNTAWPRLDMNDYRIVNLSQLNVRD